MQKTINIDGRDVKFKASASIIYRYKQYFQKDLLEVIMPFISVIYSGVAGDGVAGDEEIDIQAIVDEAKDNLELTDITNVIWIMAKTADREISEPADWYDEFDQFPLFDVASELVEILLPSMVTTEKSKKKLTRQMKKATRKSAPQPSSPPPNSEESPSES